MNYLSKPCALIKNFFGYSLDKFADYLIYLAHEVDKCPSYKGHELSNLVVNQKSRLASAVLILLSMEASLVAGFFHQGDKEEDSLCLYDSPYSWKKIQPNLVPLQIDKLIKIGDKTVGIKSGGIFKTKTNEILYIKKIMLDELFLSFFMSKLACVVCPGQVATIVPVLHSNSHYPWLGSFFKKDFKPANNFTEKRGELLLHFCLDLLNVGDRNINNFGYIEDDTAFAVDVDYKDDELFNQKEWLDKLPDYMVLGYNTKIKNFLHQKLNSKEGYESLKIITNIPDTVLASIITNSYHKLEDSLSIKFPKSFSEKRLTKVLKEMLHTKKQMKWFIKNYEKVMALIEKPENNKINLINLFHEDEK